jgi:hypothetical protein
MHLLVLAIILAALLLINLVPVGVDGGFAGTAPFLSARAGPFTIGILPKRDRAESPRQRQARLAKKAEQKAKKEEKKKRERLEEKKKGSRFATARELVRMGMRTLSRLRRHLCVDLFLLRWTAAASNPYDAAMQYGAVCAALGTLVPMAERTLKIRECEMEVNVRFDLEKPEIEARILLTLRIWEIVWVGLNFGMEYLRWRLNHRRKTGDTERKNGNGE